MALGHGTELDLVTAIKGFQSSREDGVEADDTVQSGKFWDGIKFVLLWEHIRGKLQYRL